MDGNKLEVLRDAGYRVEGCGACLHFSPGAAQAEFGLCARWTYEHRKHVGPARELSVSRHGTCPEFAPSPGAAARLGAFQEFLPTGP